MSDDTLRTSADARALTRRRREKRADHEIAVPVNERAPFECPDCGESTSTLIAGDPDSLPSFSSCKNWDCDAFLKFAWNGEDGSESAQSGVLQTGLGQFAGGESA